MVENRCQAALATCCNDEAFDLRNSVGYILGEPLAEIGEFRIGALALEGNDKDGVALQQYRCDAALGQASFSGAKYGYITALGQLDEQFVVGAFFKLIAGEPCAKPSGLDANDGVAAGIEVGFFVEDVLANGELFQLIAATG